ncbi:Bifunctional solanapyrone synthase [Fusarium oxysporum f. sp. cubense]|uniref:Bifunctional solanapyrone synthase n=1 Tax=Fusarium oxysporum f. sp. cubense TaxID=61366 RepID=A0A559LJX7_FUSOC|nr:Bifunctional solanapyrone synthase [Fusarium oxysporum f. sp. cubense]
MQALTTVILLLGACPYASEARSFSCCDALANIPQLKNKVYMPETTQYDQRLETYYSANAALEPWCMVMPESTQDVSRVAKVVSKHSCPFGIRSGAHSAFRRANGVDYGITIDFGHMNATVYDAKHKLAKIQPGSNWGHVYEALDPYGVAAVGGRASVVGVGGFITGGGYSFHSNVKGFACDQVVNFEVVLADGKIVDANRRENPDLWKALKGGSGNVGFVTRIDQRVVNSNQLWGGFVVFDLAQRDAVFNAYIKFVEANEEDAASQLIVSVQYDGKQRLLLSVVSNSDAKESPPAFSPLLSIPNTSNTLTRGKIADLVPQFTGPTPLGLYANWMTGMTENDIRIIKFMDEKHEEYVDKMKAAAPGSDFSVLVQFQPVTALMVSHARENGGNVLGLEDVTADGPTLMWLIAVTVDTAENQEKIYPLTLEYRAAVNAYATAIGINKNWEYLNYALGDQNPLSHYGARNIQTMRRASKKYDPHGVFQRLRASGFKMPE